MDCVSMVPFKPTPNKMTLKTYFSPFPHPTPHPTPPPTPGFAELQAEAWRPPEPQEPRSRSCSCGGWVWNVLEWEVTGRGRMFGEIGETLGTSLVTFRTPSTKGKRQNGIASKYWGSVRNPRPCTTVNDTVVMKPSRLVVFKGESTNSRDS